MGEFEKILKDFEPLIYHLIHKYQIRDLEGEFYQEGAIALWKAYQQHDPDKSKFSTFAYYSISRSFLNKIAKDNRSQKKLHELVEQARAKDFVQEDEYGIDRKLLLGIQDVLTANQWIWFVGFVLQDQSVRSIAKAYGVTENAVKNWGRLARKKIKVLLNEQEK